MNINKAKETEEKSSLILLIDQFLQIKKKIPAGKKWILDFFGSIMASCSKSVYLLFWNGYETS